MAARVLHFGQELCAALPVLRSAGYSVEFCRSVPQLRANLETGDQPDAVSMTDEIVCGHEDAVSAARSRSFAPLILFRQTDRDWFPDIEYDPTEAEFDLIVPRAAPASQWLSDIADVIAQCREVLALSRQLRRKSSQLRLESSQVCHESSRLLAECGYELRRFQFQRQRATQLRFDGVPVAPPIGIADRLLKCVDCGKSFVFPAGEQVFFREKGLHDPTRCGRCRRKARESSHFVLSRTVCSECGVSTMVPFKPTQGRPVLCRSCFRESRP
jgi:CxxC-x17-CxxC domain-containing protein